MRPSRRPSSALGSFMSALREVRTNNDTKSRRKALGNVTETALKNVTRRQSTAPGLYKTLRRLPWDRRPLFALDLSCCRHVAGSCVERGAAVGSARCKGWQVVSLVQHNARAANHR